MQFREHLKHTTCDLECLQFAVLLLFNPQQFPPLLGWGRSKPVMARPVVAMNRVDRASAGDSWEWVIASLHPRIAMASDFCLGIVGRSRARRNSSVTGTEKVQVFMDGMHPNRPSLLRLDSTRAILKH